MSLADLLAALSIAALVTGAASPVLAGALRSWRLDAAARAMAMQIHHARAEAAARGRHAGIRFEPQHPGGGRWRLHLDGGGQPGLSSAEMASGTDRPLGPSMDMAASHPGVRFGIARGGAPRIPPSGGSLFEGDDPIAFGSSDICSASPTGETSSGTIYLTDGVSMRAVVVYGATGRVRLWRHEPGRGWRLS